METNARYVEYQGKEFRNEDGTLVEGDIFKNNVIMRFHNGLLDGQGEPAIECIDGHMEDWTAGYITKIDDIRGKYSEVWKDGVRIK